jgi:hypothetical protein
MNAVPKNEEKQIKKLNGRGFQLIRWAPKIWENTSEKTIIGCKNKLQSLYGQHSDLEYAKLLLKDYACWVYKTQDGEPKTYIYVRVYSSDKSRTGEVLYKPLVKTWLRFFHIHPRSEYKKLKCDIKKPTHDVRICESEKRGKNNASNRSTNARGPRNLRVSQGAEEIEVEEHIANSNESSDNENEEEVDDIEDDYDENNVEEMVEETRGQDMIVDDDHANSRFFSKRKQTSDPIEDDTAVTKYLTSLKTSSKLGRSVDDIEESKQEWKGKPSKSRAQTEIKKKRTFDDIEEGNTFSKMSNSFYGTLPTPLLKMSSLKGQAWKMVTFVQSNASYFRNYSLDGLSILKEDCDDEFLSMYPKVFDVQKIVKVLSTELMNGANNKNGQSPSIKVLRELKPKQPTTPLAKRNVIPLLTNNSASYFPPTTSQQTKHSMLLQKLMSADSEVKTPTQKHFPRVPLPDLIKVKPSENFWKLMCIQNYFIEQNPELARLELTKSLSQYSVEEEIILTTIFINCFTPKKTSIDAMIADLPESTIIAVDNWRMKIFQTKSINDTLSYVSTHSIVSDDAAVNEMHISTKTKSHSIVGDQFDILKDLYKKIREKSMKIEPQKAIEQLKNVTSFFQRLDLSLFLVFIAALNTWFPPTFVAFNTTFQFTQNELQHELVK